MRRYTLLIVDDEPGITDMIKSYFASEYDVLTAYSGREALQKLAGKPDLILLDYEMPVCDGSHVLEMLRSEEAFKDIPVIFLTGRRDTESMIKVMLLKPAGYLLKTSKPAELKQKIDAFFAGQRH